MTKIIQIMPAHGWWAIFKHDDAATEEMPLDEVKVFAFGLTDDEKIEALLWEGKIYENAMSIENFDRLVYRG